MYNIHFVHCICNNHIPTGAHNEKWTPGPDNFHSQALVYCILEPWELSACTIPAFPGLHTQLLSLAVQKAGGRPGRIYHVMCATADVIYARLSLVSPRIYVAAIARARCWHLQPRRLYGVCDPFAWLGAVTKTILSTWVHQWQTSRDKSFQAFPLLFVLQATKAGVEAWERVYNSTILCRLSSKQEYLYTFKLLLFRYCNVYILMCIQ